MAWITNDGVQDTWNVSVTTGTACIFMLKETMKQAGWTVLSSSDGTVYNASGDQIISGGSGPGGMNNTSAWFLITDPATERSYIFQRTTNMYTWIWQYSRSDGFDKAGGATTIPTQTVVTDMVGIRASSSLQGTAFPTSGTWSAHCAVQNTAYNGVYAFWLLVYDSGETTTLYCDPLEVETAGPTGDDDPCVHLGEASGPSVADLDNQTSGKTDCWMLYGTDNQFWGPITACDIEWNNTSFKPAAATAALGDNASTGAPIILPMHYFRYYTVTVGGLYSPGCGYKGKGVYVKWSPGASYVYNDIVKVGTGDYYVVWGVQALRGWSTTTLPA